MEKLNNDVLALVLVHEHNVIGKKIMEFCGVSSEEIGKQLRSRNREKLPAFIIFSYPYLQLVEHHYRITGVRIEVDRGPLFYGARKICVFSENDNTALAYPHNSFN